MTNCKGVRLAQLYYDNRPDLGAAVARRLAEEAQPSRLRKPRLS